MQSPVAELVLDESEIRALLVSQHPDLGDLPLVHLDSGWDNDLWRLGEELVLRFPRRQAAVRLALNEQRWLPEIARALPLPVPLPVRVGKPSTAFPWPWSIVPWLDGNPGDLEVSADARSVAKDLGHFLRALHHPAPPDAPVNPVRGVPIRERDGAFRSLLADLSDEVDVASATRVWENACRANLWDRRPCWLHGDLHPANVVFRDGRLAGILDFGDMCAGDPATDLAAMYMLLPTDAHPAFVSAYGRVDADLEARARGWATHLGLVLLGIGLDRSPSGRPSYTTIGRETLARAFGA